VRPQAKYFAGTINWDTYLSHAFRFMPWLVQFPNGYSQ
jgi:hypothetical protein